MSLEVRVVKVLAQCYWDGTHVWLGPLRVNIHEQAMRAKTRARTKTGGSTVDMLGGEQCDA